MALSQLYNGSRRSHSIRNDMFELSHRLIGIYKTSNATRSKHSLLHT